MLVVVFEELIAHVLGRGERRAWQPKRVQYYLVNLTPAKTCLTC